VLHSFPAQTEGAVQSSDGARCQKAVEDIVLVAKTKLQSPAIGKVAFSPSSSSKQSIPVLDLSFLSMHGDDNDDDMQSGGDAKAELATCRAQIKAAAQVMLNSLLTQQFILVPSVSFFFPFYSSVLHSSLEFCMTHTPSLKLHRK
jgi:hypothetical protein